MGQESMNPLLPAARSERLGESGPVPLSTVCSIFPVYVGFRDQSVKLGGTGRDDLARDCWNSFPLAMAVVPPSERSPNLPRLCLWLA